MEISKPYKEKANEIKKDALHCERIYFLLCFLLDINHFYLFSLRLKYNADFVVNHPDYVAKINDDNKFPIKFGALAEHLLKEDNN